MSYFKQISQYEALTGGEAVAEAMRQIEPGVVPIYPITPQTPIVEKFASLVASGAVSSEIITAESEHSVMSMAIGAAASGVRAMTATSSVGLAYMFEMLNIASGMRLPIVLNVASRTLSAPINIHCDHGDVMGVRDSGFLQIFSESAQEVYDHTILAVRLAEDERVLLPVIVVQDGFETSHLLERLEKIEDSRVKKFIGEYHYPHSLLNPKKKSTFGPLVMPKDYLSIKVDQWEAMEGARKVYSELAEEMKKITGRDFSELELFQINDQTEAAVVVLGSSAGALKAMAKKLKEEEGYNVGVIKVKLFRPFPYAKMRKALKNIPRIAVLDRTFSFGSQPPLFSEVCQSLFNEDRIADQKVQSYVFGLGGKTLKESEAEEVFADILSNNFSKKSKIIGNA